MENENGSSKPAPDTQKDIHTAPAQPAVNGGALDAEPKTDEFIDDGRGIQLGQKRAEDKNFELSTKAQDKLSVNKDFSPRTNAEPGPDQGKSEQTNADKVDVKTGDEKAVNGTPIEQPKPGEKDTDSVGDDKDFEGKVGTLAATLYKTPEERLQLMKDLENHQKFMASNTRKAQEIADAERVVEALATRLGSQEVVEALDALNKAEDRDDFLASADDWFNGPENNPMRKVVEAFTKNAVKAAEYSKEQEKKADEQAAIELEREVLSVQRLKDSPFDYMNPEEVKTVANLADQYHIPNLLAAHKIRLGEHLEAKVKEMTGKVDALSKELDTLKKENADLKARGAAPAKKVPEKPPEAEAKVIPFNQKKDQSRTGTFRNAFDEAEERIRKKMAGS